MDAKELRQLSVEELNGKVRQWQEELFRHRFKAQSQEMRDTSVFKKLRKDIARAKLVLGEFSKRAAAGNEVVSNART